MGSGVKLCPQQAQKPGDRLRYFFSNVSEVGDSGWHKVVLALAGRTPLSLMSVCPCSH